MQLARLKPRAQNPRAHKLQSYTVFGIKFLESRGWYEVDDDVAAYLKTVKQIQEGPDAPFSADAFDVVATLEEAQALDEAEKKRVDLAKAEQAHKTSAPQTTNARRPAAGTVTTRDFADETPARPKKGESFDDMDDTFPADGQPIETRSKAPAVVIDGADDEGDEPEPEPAPARPSAKPSKGKR